MNLKLFNYEKNNVLAIKVYPVDMAGTVKPKGWEATGEFHNGGDGNIGLNTTMLMSAGWDFTFNDGIRDRNTGIWKQISLYATDKVMLQYPFVRSELSKPNYNVSEETISVEVTNPTQRTVTCVLKGEIVGENIKFEKQVKLLRGETLEVVFNAEDFPQLIIRNPRLWWPLFKGKQELYELKITAEVDGNFSDEVKTRLGIREIRSDQCIPDKSRQFYVNGKKIFIRGTNWIPEAMLRHPSLAYYVSSNESTEMPDAKKLIMHLDDTRGYQMQSECDGVHDGSPYKQVNPMQHYENTASARGSRVDGFNPEYGAPTLPTVETLREMMDEKDLWPINKKVWDYHDGGGFHLMSTMYKDLTEHYGTSSTIDEFARKGQLVGAMNSKSIWEVWNYNKYHYGDRYASGLLFWYHNCPVKQVSARMWDYSLEPTASLYYTQNALEPLHVQFDYLKNSVSVYNDYYKSFENYSVSAEVYDLNTKKVWSKTMKIDIPEDGV